MARGLYFLCTLVIFAAAAAVAEAHGTAFATAGKVNENQATVKLVVQNVADRRITLNCAEVGRTLRGVVAESGQWTSIGSFGISSKADTVMHLTVGVATGKQYGGLKKSLVIDLMKQFQNNLRGNKFLLLRAVENARERTLKIMLGNKAVLTFLL